jgi:transglutaminase-like putative cysteine protease
MKLSIRHITRYTYTQPLLHSVQSLHLWPVSGPSQHVDFWSLKSLAVLHGRIDALGNHVHHGSIAISHSAAPVLATEVVASGQLTTFNVADWCDPPHLPDPSLFLRSTHMTEPHPRMSAWASALLGQPLSELVKGPTGVDQVLTLATAVGQKVGYRKGQTGVDTVALEAFDWGLGVCQDQAHVMVAVCRSIGWPARYVSGYFFDPNEPDLASHAWADVCVDAATRRWVSVDITHACLTDERHARLAVGTDYSTCPPVKGLRRGGGQETMAVDVSIFAM